MANSFASEEPRNPQHDASAKNQAKKDRSMQKMIILMTGSAVACGAASYFADKWKFPEVGTFFNVSRRGIKAGFSLSGILAGLSLIGNEKWSPTFRSAALRVWAMPFVGGIISHPKVHEGLQRIPYGIGDWCKEYSPTDLEIGSIYAISTWAMVKPSFDELEARTTGLIERFENKI